MTESINANNAYHRGCLTSIAETLRRELTKAQTTLKNLLDRLPMMSAEELKTHLVSLEASRLDMMDELRRAFQHAQLIKPIPTAGDPQPPEQQDLYTRGDQPTRAPSPEKEQP